MIISKVKISGLRQFVNSDLYKGFENKPISLLRVESYLNNPKMNVDDVVVYMAIKNERLIGYKTILGDAFQVDNKDFKFGWLSGTWTHPKNRRQGVSLLLLNEVLKDWSFKLIYTNYAEESKAVYDKSESFSLLKSKKGYRHYLRICFNELLPPKVAFFKRNKRILIWIDAILNFVFDVRFVFIKIKKHPFYVFDEISDWDTEIDLFLETYKEKELFKRTKSIFTWIKEYPWIRTDSNTEKLSKKYYFSSYSNRFSSKWFRLYNRQTKKTGAITLIKIKGNHLKIPYLYYDDKDLGTLKDEIINLCKVNKISYLTSYDEKLNKLLLQQNVIKISSKKFTQNFFITKELLAKNSKAILNCDIQSGDGDGVFT